MFLFYIFTTFNSEIYKHKYYSKYIVEGFFSNKRKEEERTSKFIRFNFCLYTISNQCKMRKE